MKKGWPIYNIFYFPHIVYEKIWREIFQSAYLIGCCDVDSVPGPRGVIVDQRQLDEYCLQTKMFCQTVLDLLNGGQTLEKGDRRVLEAATSLAKNTSLLANACRDAASRCRDMDAKRQFIK